MPTDKEIKIGVGILILLWLYYEWDKLGSWLSDKMPFNELYPAPPDYFNSLLPAPKPDNPAYLSNSIPLDSSEAKAIQELNTALDKPPQPKLDSSTPDVNPDCSINIPGSTKTIGDIAKQYGITNVPDSLVAAIQEQESRRNPNIGTNSSGATGIGQIVCKIWCKKYGITQTDLNNPEINTSITLRIMSDAIRKYGNIPTAVHSYYGFGTPTVGPSGDTYTRQVLDKWKKYMCSTNDGSKAYGPLGPAYCPTSPKGIT